MSFWGGKTNIERVIDETTRAANEDNLDITIDVSSWRGMNQFGYMNPKKLALAIYFYSNLGINKLGELKRIGESLKKSKNLVGKITSVDKEVLVKLHAVLLKYLVNMINYR